MTGNLLRAVWAYLNCERPETTLKKVFVISGDDSMNYKTLGRLLSRLCAVAKMLPVFSHAIRRGGDQFSAQRIMGHTTLAMTNRYARLDTDDLRDVHRRSSPVAGLRRQS